MGKRNDHIGILERFISTVWIKKVKVEARLEAMRQTNKLLQLYRQEMIKVVVE